MDATLEITKVLAALDRKKETHKLSHYKPYGFQIAFHNALGFKTETPASQRALMAGNKVGKTLCGGMEAAMHLTGRYPDWFKGRRFYHSINMLVGGYTNESVRDLCQAELFGDPTDDRKLGTGSIPIECIGKVTRKAGVPNALDVVQVKHVSGAWSK